MSDTIFTSHYKVAGTKSGRSSATKLFDYYGGNAQNIPDDTRRLIVPRAGMKFAQNDYEAGESVIVALTVREGNFRELIRRKIKPHNFVCVKLFPPKFEEYLSREEILGLLPVWFKENQHYDAIIKLCKKLHVEYDLAKRTGHGANYGMSWKTFRTQVLKETRGLINLSPAEAKRLLAEYFDIFPEIRERQAMIEDLVYQFKPLYDLFGYSAVLFERFTAGLGRTGISYCPQRTLGIMMLVAATRFQNYIEEVGANWNLLTVTHDSGLLEAPDNEVVAAADKLAECMYFEFNSPVDGWKTTVGVEKSIGDNWGKYDEEKNPLGVRPVK